MTDNPCVSRHAIDFLRSFLRERSGILLGANKDYLVSSRLEPELGQWGLRSLAQLAARLAADPRDPIGADVVSLLATHETSWFRDSNSFEVLRERVLQEVLARNASTRSVSIWSAACSTGQEPYSIAMMLHEEGIADPMWRPTILASDIATDVLDYAREGAYSSLEVQRGLNEQRLLRHFRAEGQRWRINDTLRRSVVFQAINLIALPDDLKPFDIIFCRNVLIYFDAELQASVLNGIRARLRPGGFLFLGAAETTFGMTRELMPYPGVSSVYMRPDN